MPKSNSPLCDFHTTSGSLDVSICNEVGQAGIVLSSSNLFRVQVSDGSYVSANTLKIGFYDENARDFIAALLDFCISNDYRPPLGPIKMGRPKKLNDLIAEQEISDVA